ncbi:MAG: DNA-3-methyladenine glycosylase 2 family protein [Angelakisella sp.]|jgi:N-glycosylase/DNA lyase|nr:DNA-3-methyladenine glycosylase 2 family protein [Angelakisella sp.]
MPITIEREPAGIRLKGAGRQFALSETLDCGQAFRWRQREDGCWEGVAGGRYLCLESQGEDIFLQAVPEADLPFWRRYFDLERDYEELAVLFRKNPCLRRALAFCPGIRVLRQEPWEALCTFILSANNNIPRIKGIVERLCQGWGEAVPGTGLPAFPKPEALAPLGEEDLAPLRAGWRSAYLLDAARQVAGGRLDLEETASLPTQEAEARLLEVKGVGKKVAQCVLLFGFGRVECIPMDVWMKRVMAELYPRGFPGYLRPYGGIAQQVLFHYYRQGRS